MWHQKQIYKSPTDQIPSSAPSSCILHKGSLGMEIFHFLSHKEGMGWGCLTNAILALVKLSSTLSGNSKVTSENSG